MTTDSKIKTVSFLLVAALCAAALFYGLLPGVIATCLGFMAASAMTHIPIGPKRKLPSAVAVTVVILGPLVLLGLLLAQAKGYLFSAVNQYSSLMGHLADTVLQLREKLPESLAHYVPEHPTEIQEWFSGYLKSQSAVLTHMGKSWLEGLLLAYLGLIIGALLFASKHAEQKVVGKRASVKPLRLQMRMRGQQFLDSFKQVVVAQFWIASFNTVCTAVFLLIALPAAGQHIPYAASLVLFTFIACLIPVLGNLMCNAVLALAGVSVSPAVGLACFVFLILIHKAEYIINSRVLGTRTNTAIWELLAVLFVGEALFGMAGLIAAPLYYTYLKGELTSAHLI